MSNIPYDPEVITRILERAAQGEAVRHICAEPGMPSLGTLQAWRKKSPKFKARWKEAMRQKRGPN